MTACRKTETVGVVGRAVSRGQGFARPVGILVLVSVLLSGCQLVPSKPDAVFILYRDRMKTESIVEARDLLSDKSRALAEGLASQYKLDQPPEALALLSALDPTSVPTVMQSEDTLALLQVRTLKGGLRIVRMVRKDASGAWKLDMTEELASLKSFLNARSALETMKDQAGEYAASWKAFNDQYNRITPPPDSEPVTRAAVPKPISQKTSPAGHAKKTNHRKNEPR